MKYDEGGGSSGLPEDPSNRPGGSEGGAGEVSQILGRISDAFFALDRELVVTYFNPAAEKQLGRPKNEVLGRPLFDAFPEARGSIFEEEYRKALASGQTTVFETFFEVEPYRGWYEVRAYPGPAGLSVYFQLITDRKEAQAVLDETNQQLEASNQQLRAANQQLGAMTQQLEAMNHQLRAVEQELRATNQQLDASNQQLLAANQQLQATNQQLWASQETLRQKERRYRLAQELSGVGLWSWNLETGEVYWSEEILDMWGLEPGEFTGELDQVADRIHPDDLEAWKESVRACLEDGVQHRLDFRICHPGGGVRWVSALGDADRDQEGKVTEMVGLAMDITDLRESEAALRASEAFLDTVVDQSPFAMWISDSSGTVIRTNQSLRETLGVSDEEIVGRYSVFEDGNLESQGVLPQVKAVFEELESARFSISWEAGRAGGVDFDGGRDLHIEVAMFPVTAPGDELDYVVCQWVDVTERHEAERRLAETNAILQAALDNSQAGIAIADAPDGRLRYVNRAGLLIRGADVEEVVEGVGVEEYVASWQILDLDGTPLKEDEVPLARAVLYGETNSREFIVRRSDESDRIVWANAGPILDEQGEVMAAIVVFLDITDRKTAEAELAEKTALLHDSHRALRGLTHRLQAIREQEREELARNLHDELGEALTVHRMDLAELRKKAGDEGKPIVEDVSALLESADVAIELMRDYCVQLHSPVLELMGVGAALRAHVELLANRAPMTFQIEIEDGDLRLGPEVEINLFRIAQEALTNILRHSEAEEVEVRLEKDDEGAVRLLVADDGVGFDPKKLKVGRSLGLLGMRERAMAIGGSLTVEGRDEGGTAVCLTLHPKE